MCIIYKLKNNSNNTLEKITIIKKEKIEFLYKSMYDEMCEIKKEIDINPREWNKAKKLSNPYELVTVNGTNVFKDEEYYTENNIPLSRAFFKLIEIILEIDIIPDTYRKTPGVIANIAEGPGGFVEALYKYRSQNGFNDFFYCITLFSEKKNIPGWEQLYRRKKHFLHNKHVTLKTGDIYNINDIINYSKYFKNKKAWLVTCDGGFDYSNDFNNQEINSFKIIFAELTTSLYILEEGGSMICKMFDLFTKCSIQIIYLFTLLFKNVYITKPVTSRPANSEKYIVSTGFKGVTDIFISSMLDCIKKWDIKCKDSFEFNIPIPQSFIKDCEYINIFFSNNQKNNILKTFGCFNKKIYNTFQQKKSEEWFTKYNIQKKIYIKG